MQNATILAFPKRSMPEANLSVEDEWARLRQNLLALAAAAREYRSAIDDLAHCAADRLTTDEHDLLSLLNSSLRRRESTSLWRRSYCRCRQRN
jgi:hypothetical protein